MRGMEGFVEKMTMNAQLFSDCSGAEGSLWALKEIFTHKVDHVASQLGFVS